MSMASMAISSICTDRVAVPPVPGSVPCPPSRTAAVICRASRVPGRDLAKGAGLQGHDHSAGADVQRQATVGVRARRRGDLPRQLGGVRERRGRDAGPQHAENVPPAQIRDRIRRLGPGQHPALVRARAAAPLPASAGAPAEGSVMAAMMAAPADNQRRLTSRAADKPPPRAMSEAPGTLRP